MGKAKKAWKQNTKGHIPKDQFHQVKVGSIKKNKDSKFKNTPTGKVALINSSKVQNKNVKYVPSQKNAQEGFADAKNKNKNLPIQASKSNAKQLKQGSPNGKKKFSSKAKNKASKNKFIFNPEETELFDDSSSEVNEETKSQKDVSLNKTDKTFKDEDSDTDTPDIFGNSLADDSDEDDEDFEEDEVEEEEDDDDDDSDEEETVEYKGVKMFEGLKHKAKKNYADKVAQENDDNDDDDDKGENDENMTFDESDEDDEDNEDEDDDDNDEQQIRNINGHGDISPMETDEDDDKDEDDDYDDDDDDDDMDEEMGLKALLGKSIADDDDDEDFNEENEDDEDDDISSEDDSGEDEDDEENDASNYKRVKAITKEKTDEAVNKEDIQVEHRDKAKHTQYMEEYRESLERIVIIENISEVTTKGQIMQLFSKFGTIKQVFLEPLIVLKTAKDPTTPFDTMQPKLLSFIGKLLYSNKKSALNAVKAMHGKIVDGNYLMIQVLNKYNGPYDTGKVVYVTNLKKDVKLNDIWKAFRECGDINCVEVNRDQETKGCQCSYIHFSTEEAVSNALKLRNIVEVMGQKVSVFKIRFNPDDRDWYRNEAFIYRPPVSEKGIGRYLSWLLSEDHDGNPVKELKNSLGESAALNVKREGNIKKHKEQQGDDEGMKSTAFQGQKVNLKNKKKKNKLDKKKRKMAEKLTAKSVKI